MSTKHTEGPVTLDIFPDKIGLRASGKIVSGYIAVVATDWAHKDQCEQQRANAQRLTLAWNCHDELVESLGGLLTQLNRF